MIAGALSKSIQRRWYGRQPLWPLVPLAVLFGGVVALRRVAYERGWLRSYRVSPPVLVVGNVTVGGSGKTPLTLAVIERAQQHGLRVGVVSRGYGGQAERYPLAVNGQTSAEAAGDEPVLIARRTGVPVVVAPDRVAAARALVERGDVDLIVADDGLQHYRLVRDAEIVVADARRGNGNGWLLPAGPLREPAQRSERADLCCVHGQNADFWLAPGQAVNLDDDQRRPLAEFAGAPVHAVAGIGEPARFFDMLRAAGLTVIEHAMADHHRYRAEDLAFESAGPVLMTEKDAVKCGGFDRDDLWMVPVETRLSSGCAARIDALLARLARSGTRAQEQGAE
ncbi:tetraacyldisaccharide 4'-kinase [Salinisphaera sp. SPP-AMP-43]|uniref:tetraacyldisaccharide 4'-kinase n=1 Tax=Salinisphaera sp. SPP-AMP-43 TaxID=3121288 RepID=UPI003C6E1711